MIDSRTKYERELEAEVAELKAEIERLNHVVNEMLTDMSRNPYTAQCKGSVTPHIVSVPTQRRSWWMR